MTLLFQFVYAQPVIQSISPSKGPVGTEVTITGSGFSQMVSDNVVFFGPVRARITSAAASQLRVIVPPGAAGNRLSVTTAKLTCYANRPFLVTFTAKEQILRATFNDPFDSTTGIHPNGVIAMDIDDDGKPDIITCDEESNGISVLRNNSSKGSLSFLEARQFSVSEVPYGIHCADLDGDGKQDIITTSVINNEVMVLRNRSTPDNIDFESGRTFATGQSPYEVVAADFDRDGRPDLVVSNFFGNTVSVLTNTSASGTISFSDKMDFITGLSPHGLTCADFNGDGVTDIAVTNELSNTLSVLINTGQKGTINFASKIDINTGLRPVGIASGDFDGDGLLDLACANSIADENYRFTISVFRNNSSGGVVSFGTGMGLSSVGASPTHISTVDLDGDGIQELIVSSVNMSVFKNFSSVGNISFRQVDFLGLGGFDGVAADLDEDDKPDIASAKFTASAVSFLRNRLDEPRILYITPGVAKPGAVVNIVGANFTGISKVMFGKSPATSFTVVSSTFISATVGQGGSGAVSVIGSGGTAIKDGFLFLGPPKVDSVYPATGGKGDSIVVYGDNFTGTTNVNFGGVPAMSFTIESNIKINAVLGSGGTGNTAVTTPYGTDSLNGFVFIYPPELTSFSPVKAASGQTVAIKGLHLETVKEVRFGSTPASTFSYTSGGVNATVSAGTSGKIIVVTRGGADTIPGFEYILPPPPVINSMTPASGKAGTVITITGMGFSSTIGRNTVTFGPVQATVVKASPTQLQVIAPVSGGSGSVTVLNMDNQLSAYAPLPFHQTVPYNADLSASSFAEKVTYSTARQPMMPLVVDLDNDGKPEIITPDNGSNTITVYFNESQGATLSFRAQSNYIGTTAFTLAAGDVDGDGRQDVIVGSTGGIIVKLNTGKRDEILSTLGTYKIDRTNNFYNLAVRDVDLDGRPDIIGLKTFTDSIYIFHNEVVDGTVNFRVVAGLAVNRDAQGVAVADFDGDGLPDIASGGDYGPNPVFKNISSSGHIAFEETYNIVSGLFLESLIAPDLDGDQRPDIVFGGSYTVSSVVIFPNTRSGNNFSFGAPVYLPGTFYDAAHVITECDLNGDGKTDIACGGVGGYEVYQNMTSPAGINLKSIVAGKSGVHTYLAAGDFNADGKTDFVVSDWSASTISIFRNQMNVVYNTKVGDWNDPSVWSNNKVPGSTDDVVLNFDVTISTDAVCHSLTTGNHKVNIKGNQHLSVTGP